MLRRYASLWKHFFTPQVIGCSLPTVTSLFRGCLSWISWLSSCRCRSPTQTSDSGSALLHTLNFPSLFCRLASKWLLNHQRCMSMYKCSLVSLQGHTGRKSLYRLSTHLLHYDILYIPMILTLLHPVVFRVWKPTWHVCTRWWRKLNSAAAQNLRSTGGSSTLSAFFTASC